MKQTTLTKQRPAPVDGDVVTSAIKAPKTKCKGISSAGALKSSGPQMAVF